MGTPLKNPPVYFTLAQTQFNPILKLEDFLPDIQECFRQTGYPDFDYQNILSIELNTLGNQPPNSVQQKRFQFGNVEKTHAFILDERSLTLQSTDYGYFERFSSCFLEGLHIVHDAVKLDFAERVGLRYLDRVMPQPGEIIDQYLIEQVHGLNKRLRGQSLYSYTEAMSEVKAIKLLSRVAIRDGSLAFPPDIQPDKNMYIAEKFKSYEGISAIIDNDGFIKNRAPFSEKTVADHLNAIHEIIGAAFKALVTPHAMTTWDQ